MKQLLINLCEKPHKKPPSTVWNHPPSLSPPTPRHIITHAVAAPPCQQKKRRKTRVQQLLCCYFLAVCL